MRFCSTKGLTGSLLGAPMILLLAVAGPVAAQSPGLHAYTRGHAMRDNPPDLLGGPLRVSVHQDQGSTRWVLPGPRFLDPSVFGSPDQPVGMDPAPFPLLGVPVDLRNSSDGDYTFIRRVAPFSDWREVGVGSVNMEVVDATAIDGGRTKDKIDFEATFKSPDDKFDYRVTAEKPIPHGMAYPFFGGVTTNQLMHGATGVGSKQMPTEFAYAAFWAMGNVYRDGELVNENQLVHVMVTEVVRGEGYKLDFDGAVGDPPSGITLHLMVPPFKPGPSGLVDSPVRTGFVPFPAIQQHMMQAMQMVQQLPENERAKRMAVMGQIRDLMGQTKEHVMQEMQAGRMDGQPFFHVMFGNVTMEGGR